MSKRTDTGNGLTYPFETPPDEGRVLEVADGVFWVRMPLPFELNHINTYLLRDDAGWTVVDTGTRGTGIQGLWDRIFENELGGEPIKRVISTHLHPDHTGLAGWITRRFQAELWMTRSEFYLLKMLSVDGPRDVPEDAITFYETVGFSPDHIDGYRLRFGSFGSMIAGLPAGYRRLRDGDQIPIGGRLWEVVVGRGHSPEHACLYCAELGVILSGDQVLPRITPNVSVTPTEPFADPLGEFLDSCETIPGRVASDVLTLPAHNLPFRGVHERIQAIADHHHDALSRLHRECGAPKTALEVFPVLFSREIDDRQFFMAAGESLAHLNYLLARGHLHREIGPDGIARYEQGEIALEASTREGAPLAVGPN